MSIRAVQSTAPDTEPNTETNDWGDYLYTYVVIITSGLMLIPFTITLFKACKGSRYVFLYILISLFIISNIGCIGTAYYNHRVGVIEGNLKSIEDLDIDKFIRVLNAQSAFGFLRDFGCNEAFWLFSYRYFIISYIMPWRLKDLKIPVSFKIGSTAFFIIGLLANAIAPAMECYYIYRYNNAILDMDTAVEVQAEVVGKYYAFKYSIGGLEFVSGLLMIVAICKLYKS